MLRHFLTNALLAGVAILCGVQPAAAQRENRQRDTPSGVLSCQFADGYHIMMREITCPIGGEKFTDAAMGVSYSIWDRRLDFKPYGSIQFPLPLPVCPSGMVVYKSQFDDPAEREKVEKIIQSSDYQAKLKGNTAYYMLAEIERGLGHPAFNVGHRLLQASWEAEECDAAGPLRAAYQRQALDRFRSAASELEPQSRDWWTAQLISAELERQLGEFEAAQARLDALPQDGLAQQGLYQRMAEQISALSAARKRAPARLEKARSEAQ